jgi:hypothetical protein
MHNPGSADAIGRGCTCDFIKNDFGRGQTEPNGVAFYCTETCPVHCVLLNLTAQKTEGGTLEISNKVVAALKWLKSPERARKRPPDQI